MSRFLLILIFLAGSCAWADEPVQDEPEQNAENNGDGIERPKTMSGMSILGNEEAPKALVIIPWK